MPKVVGLIISCGCCRSRKRFEVPEEEQQVKQYGGMVCLLLDDDQKLKMKLCPACLSRTRDNVAKINDCYVIESFLDEFKEYDLREMIVALEYDRIGSLDFSEDKVIKLSVEAGCLYCKTKNFFELPKQKEEYKNYGKRIPIIFNNKKVSRFSVCPSCLERIESKVTRVEAGYLESDLCKEFPENFF